MATRRSRSGGARGWPAAVRRAAAAWGAVIGGLGAGAWPVAGLSADAAAEATAALVGSESPDSARRINAALRAWIAAIDADAPFLVLDRGSRRLQLHHGGAVLRDCRVAVDALGRAPAVEHELERHVRRYTRASAYREPQAGPFDWEQYLAEAATPDGALYFAGGLLLYASEVWGTPRAPAARLAPGDLRALYDALPAGAVLVVLPAGWDVVPPSPGETPGGSP